MKSKLVAFCKVCMTEKVDVYAEVHGTKGRCLHSGSLLEIQLHVNWTMLIITKFLKSAIT